MAIDNFLKLDGIDSEATQRDHRGEIELLRFAATGRHVASAVLSARRSGAGTRDFLKITLKTVLITGIQMADNGDGPVEQITLSFGEIGFDYTPQTARGGAGTPVKVNWNVRTTQVS